MIGQNKALRAGAIAAAVVGAVAIPATALAASGHATGLVERAGGLAGMSHAGGVRGIAAEEFAGPAHRGPGGPGGPGRGVQSEEHLAKLAAALNVSVDALKAAMEATRAELQGQKPATPADHRAFAERHLTVLAGKLGVSVDALKAALEANRPARPEGKGPRGGAPGQHLQSLATALGVTPEALETAMKAARDETKPTTRPATDAERQAHQDAFVAALAAKLNLSVDQVKAALEAHKPARPAKPQGQQGQRPTAQQQTERLQQMLTKMVGAGRITQAQADQISADLQAGKPVFEVLRQFMPDHQGPRGPRGNAA